MKYATLGKPQYLPPAAPTAPQRYSVPRPSGGYDYYEAPPGSSPGQNNDYPAPVVAHGNDIGVASVHTGRPLPRNARHVGSGDAARGSVTAMPGAGGEILGLEAPLSLGGLSGYGGLGALGEMTGNEAGPEALGTAYAAAPPALAAALAFAFVGQAMGSKSPAKCAAYGGLGVGLIAGAMFLTSGRSWFSPGGAP